MVQALVDNRVGRGYDHGVEHDGEHRPVDDLWFKGKAASDLDALANDITRRGLAHPVIVKPDGEVIAGRRRFAACRELGWDKVPVFIFNPEEMWAALERGDKPPAFLPTEAAVLGRLLEEDEAPRAYQRRLAGAQVNAEHRKARYEAQRRGEPVPEFENSKKRRTTRYVSTRNRAASALGLSEGTYLRIRRVADAALEDPERFDDLAVALDAGMPPHSAARELELRRQNTYAEDGPAAETLDNVPRKLSRKQQEQLIGRVVTTMSSVAAALPNIDPTVIPRDEMVLWVRELEPALRETRKFLDVLKKASRA